MKLKAKIINKTARIGIVGLGYTGLPLAVEFAKNGFTVIGLDIAADRVDGVMSGQSYLKDVKNSVIQVLVESGRLSATDDPSALADVDVVSICVPTPLDSSREPDLTFVETATRSVADHLKPEKLIVLESTTYPGTTEEVVKPILEATGLIAGKDFYLGYSPERVDPGNSKYNIKNTPKIISGHTEKCLEHMSLLYGQIVDKIVPVSSTGAAELAKLFENIFRNVNIALVNELAMICDKLGLNVWEVIESASTKPFGFMKFTPGPGLGGHCIPVDPFYLSWKARQHNFYTEFIELAGKINQAMPSHVVAKVAEALNSRQKSVNGAKVLLLGAAYKKDVADTRESPCLDIIRLLEKEKAVVIYHDPFVPVLPLDGREYHSRELTEQLLEDADCVVVATDHSATDYDTVLRSANLIVDTRNVFSGAKQGHVFGLGRGDR